MTYEEMINANVEEHTSVGEPALQNWMLGKPFPYDDCDPDDDSWVDEAEAVGDSDIVPIELQKHLSGGFLKELEENNYYLDSPIPFDTLPQSEEEWMQMAAEAEESGYVTPEEFNKHCEAWSHFN